MVDVYDGYPADMGEHTKQPVEERRPIEVDGVPEEEGLPETDTAGPGAVEPDEHVNRPDQPDFDPEEREQYERPSADAGRPEDR